MRRRLMEVVLLGLLGLVAVLVVQVGLPYWRRTEPSIPEGPEGSCAREVTAAVYIENRRRLSEASAWASYYGSGGLEELARFDLVDLDADPGLQGAYSEEDICSLESQGVLVVSYLNLGTIEDFRRYEPQLRAYSLAEYEDWPGEYWLDVTQPQVQDYLVENVARSLASRGVDGFYLDNLDLVLRYPTDQVREGILRLVERLRGAFPNHLIIAQNGLSLMYEPLEGGREFWELLDGVAVEETYWRYTGGGYQPAGQRVTRATERQLGRLLERHLPIFTLDYTLARDEAVAVAERSRDQGFVPYVADVELQTIHFLP